MLGQRRPELDNLTVCDKFEPTILEGQLCYSIDIAKLEKRQTEAGKSKGLVLLLDPSPYQIQNDERNVKDGRNKEETFKVYIHTLSPFTAYGPGAFAMSSLKRMTGTTSFLQLPENQKKCAIHNREECQTDKFFSQVKANCSCVPWSLATNDKNSKAHFFPTGTCLLWPREVRVCQKAKLERQKMFGSLFWPLCGHYRWIAQTNHDGRYYHFQLIIF